MKISRFNNRLNILTSNDLENTNTSPRTLSPDTGEHYINAYNGKLKSDGNSIPATLDLDDIFASDEPSRLDDFKISPEKKRVKDTVEDSSGDNEQKDKSNKQENESDGAKEVESDGVHEKTSSYGYVYIIIIFEAVSIVLVFISFKC
jgi:hypothetical protein